MALPTGISAQVRALASHLANGTPFSSNLPDRNLLVLAAQSDAASVIPYVNELCQKVENGSVSAGDLPGAFTLLTELAKVAPSVGALIQSNPIMETLRFYADGQDAAAKNLLKLFSDGAEVASDVPTVKAAISISSGQSKSFLVVDAQIRENARSKVLEAIAVLEDMESQGLERLLTDEYLLPELRNVVAVLELQTEAVDEILAAGESIEHAVGILEKVQKVLERGSMVALSGIVGNAAFELAKVLPHLLK